MNPNWLYFYDANAENGNYGGLHGYTQIECVGRYQNMIFPSKKAPAGWLYGHLNSMCSYLSAVAGNKPFSPSLADGAYVQTVMETALQNDVGLGEIPLC